MPYPVSPAVVRADISDCADLLTSRAPVRLRTSPRLPQRLIAAHEAPTGTSIP
jgi:hypothetical protein